ncbi:MAG: hypothetical protein P8105_06505 [Dehalococcoidia bacterium]
MSPAVSCAQSPVGMELREGMQPPEDGERPESAKAIFFGGRGGSPGDGRPHREQEN